MKSKVFVVIAAVVLMAATAFAKPLVSVSITAEKEVKTVKNGEKVKQKVPATSVDPGDVVFYTMSYVNSGDEAATAAVMDDPIPKGTLYVSGSAYGEGAEITFSIDGGKTFKKPSLLTYEFKSPNGAIEKRSASPEEYTHIRWTVSVIPPRVSGKVGFQVRMK
ncbi:MAG: DUF11 domain-containing protein [Desulfuromonadales bacterium]|nr:DUF11 domain-containing protein [Desulfuromonadales bacterium]